MLRNRFSSGGILLLLFGIHLTSTLETHDAFLSEIKQRLETEFSPSFTALNETLQDFLNARSALNATAAMTPWLVEDPPGSGNMTFDPAGLAKFKVKVKEMVDRKWDYLTQKSQLQGNLTHALYNMSAPLFQSLALVEEEEHVAGSGDDGGVVNPEGRIGGGVSVDILSLIKKMFGLHKREQDDDIDHDSTALVADANTEAQPITVKQTTTTRPTRPTRSQRRGNQGDSTRSDKYPGSYWRTKAMKIKQDFLKKKFQLIQEKKNAWKKFVHEKATASEKPTQRQEKEDEERSSAPVTQREQLLKDIKEKLWAKFESRIKDLNESRNAFLETKQEMVAMATDRPWERASVVTGSMTFDPQALLGFKRKIREMVLQKNEYVSGKESLKRDMEVELNTLLVEYLDEKSSLSETGTLDDAAVNDLGDYVDPVLDQLQQLDDVQTDVDGDNDDDSDDDAGDDNEDAEDVLGDIDIDNGVFVGLPFANALKLAAEPPGGDDNGNIGGDSGSGEVVAVAALGVVAVVAAAVLVAGVALRRAARRKPYTQVA